MKRTSMDNILRQDTQFQTFPPGKNFNYLANIFFPEPHFFDVIVNGKNDKLKY